MIVEIVIERVLRTTECFTTRATNQETETRVPLSASTVSHATPNVRTMYFTEVQADILLFIFPQILI